MLHSDLKKTTEKMMTDQQLTFLCKEHGCRETATVAYETMETTHQLRQRNPLLRDVLCDAKHSGNYRVSSARKITAVPHIHYLVP